MRIGNSARPFEHFLEALLVIFVAANITVAILLFLGVIKAPGRTTHPTSFPVPAPENYMPRR